jgi:diguanylate cyclase (GGDEF)-like protein
MLTPRVRTCAFALCLACAAPAQAAGPIDWPALADTVIHTVVPKRAMPAPMSAFTFAQDRAGFLWAGGQQGLQRWDGYQFRAYTATSGRDDGLANHYVLALHADRSGQLWVGTEEGGLARYDAATDRFWPIVLGDGSGEARRVWSLDDDGSGGLWIGTNRGVAHLDAHHRIVKAPGGTVFAVPGRKVQAVLRSRSGGLWIGDRQGLAMLGADGSTAPVALPAADGVVPDVMRLMEDRAGRVWVGTRAHGAYVVDPATLRAQAVPVPSGSAPRDGGLQISAMAEVTPGRVWLATFGHGIFDVDAGRLAVRAMTHNPAIPGTPDSNWVFGLFRDRSGVTWIGTSEAIDQFVPPIGGLQTLFGGAGRTAGIPLNVNAVLARPDGSIWLGSGTDGDGLVVLGGDGKLTRTVPLPRVLCFAAAADGPVYVGTSNGLYVIGSSGETARKIVFDTHRAAAGVTSLLLADGVLWVGGDDDDGLWELHRAADGGLRVARHFGAPPLPTASIESLALAPDGSLAVGAAHGMALLNRVSGAVEPIALDPEEPHNMAAGQVVSFLTDRLGRLWIGTDDSGIAVMLGRDAAGRPRFRHVTVADGLPDPDMNRMLSDETGRVWVATDNGLAVIDPQSFAVRGLRDADGVAIATYLDMSGDRTPQGDLLFGGHGGLTVVRPAAVGAWRYRAPVIISDIRVGGKTVRERGADIVIQPDANSLAVEFAALDLSAPDRNLYRYRLQGFDTDYLVTDARHRVASYTNLPPGRYVLQLQGSNRDGVWSEPVTCIIRVLPAWYQTIFVRIAEVVLLAMCGGGVVQGRTVWLRRRQVYLENLVRERTHELECSQQELTHLAYFDALTSLPNRRSFNGALQALLDNTATLQSEFVLILIDLDGFKRVNDTLGHDAGDALLVIAATRLRAALREGDQVARLGGDEFAILLSSIKDDNLVRAVCERVVTGMTAPVDIKGEAVKIGASVGVAFSPRHGRTAEELYKRADQALYEAKRSGKGMWRFYQDAKIAEALQKVSPAA